MVAATSDPDQLMHLARELRVALKEHIVHLQGVVSDTKATIAQMPSEAISERRKAPRKAS